MTFACLMHTIHTADINGSLTATSSEWKLSDKDGKGYQMSFSSILVSYTSLKIEKEIGQGKLTARTRLVSYTVIQCWH